MQIQFTLNSYGTEKFLVQTNAIYNATPISFYVLSGSPELVQKALDDVKWLRHELNDILGDSIGEKVLAAILFEKYTIERVN